MLLLVALLRATQPAADEQGRQGTCNSALGTCSALSAAVLQVTHCACVLLGCSMCIVATTASGAASEVIGIAQKRHRRPLAEEIHVPDGEEDSEEVLGEV